MGGVSRGVKEGVRVWGAWSDKGSKDRGKYRDEERLVEAESSDT